MRDTYEHGSHFAFHFSPILYLCAPVLWLAHSALALVAIQAIATALVAPALFLIARKRTAPGNAAAIACVALLYPPLQGVTFTDFHENAFVPAVTAWLLYALDARRFGLAALLVAAGLCIKEDQAPILACVGIATIAFFARSPQPDRTRGIALGAATIVAAALTFAAYFAVVRPLVHAPGGWLPAHFYGWSSGAPAVPLDRQLLGRLTYLLEAFVPLAFLPFRTRAIVLALPGFAEVLASREPLTYTMGQHYAAVWIPYVLVAYAIAAATLLRTRPRTGVPLVRASAALCAIFLVFISPLHLGHFLRLPNATDAATNALIARLPADASVGTYDEIYAHLGFFPNAAVGVTPPPQYVLYATGYASAYWDGVVFPEVLRMRRAGTYRLAERRDGVVLLRARPPLF